MKGWSSCVISAGASGEDRVSRSILYTPGIRTVSPLYVIARVFSDVRGVQTIDHTSRIHEGAAYRSLVVENWY